VEILFLDDASSDGSLDYVYGLRSPKKIRILTNVKNRGVFQQWKRGINEARGEFIWIAKADDSCAPSFLDKLLAQVKRHPSAGLVYSQSRTINERGRMIEETPRYLSEIHPSRWRQDYFTHGPEEVANYLILRNTVPNASACLFRSDALREIDFAEMPLRLCGDWLAYSQILRRHDIGFLAAPLNYHRQHRKTVRASSDRGDQRIRESYSVQKSIADRFRIASEIHELACRFTFREWRHLQRTAALPSNFRLSSPELLQTAKSFDPGIEQRFDSPESQSLPVLLVQRRSWRTAWRWHSQWQAYRDDQSVALRMDPFQGELRLDPLSKNGCVTIERMSFFEPNSSDARFVAAGDELGRCLSTTGGHFDWHIDAGGFHVRRSETPAFLQVNPPIKLRGITFELEIVLRANSPPLLVSPEQNDRIAK